MSSDGFARAGHVSEIIGFRLVTADLARLRQFYQGVLGCVADGPERIIGAEEMRILQLRGSGRRQALHFGTQRVAIEQFDHPGRPYPTHGNAASLWFQHLALVVTNMADAYPQVRAEAAISENGPQHLPATSGGVLAFKFRDPDGHPLELLQFPEGARPAYWRGKSAVPGQLGLGIDHSAVSVADVDASVAFYQSVGLKAGDRTLNQGSQQQQLDNLCGAEVSVVPMRPARGAPHLELLGYRIPRAEAGAGLCANDVAATRVVWRGSRDALLRDPDGHFHQISRSDDEPLA